MAKKKTIFTCNICGHETSGWLGRCPGCGSWNSLTESVISGPGSEGRHRNWFGGEAVSKPEVVSLAEIDISPDQRISSGLRELDRVLGGGFVAGSLVLLGGDPGIGKSTLLLQVLGQLGGRQKTLYISGEESARQVRMRADRLGVDTSSISLLTATEFTAVSRVLEETKPGLAVVDSIQTMYLDDLAAAPGSVSQVREVTAGLLRIAKTNDITIVLVGHVTKDGAIAGPRVLEHIVDTVLYFEGERQQNYRILRAVKNRFGATDEIGLFEMSDLGLKGIENASQAFISGRPFQAPGSVVTACMEGTRPLLVEIQALMNESRYGTPQRMVQGADKNRVGMLLAILDKHFHFGLGMDAYINVIGGIRLTEPAADLAIVSAIISSYNDRPIRGSCLIFGETGLSGEIRGVSQAQQRISEAARLGFDSIILPAGCRSALNYSKTPESCDLLFVDRISEVVDLLFI